MRARPFCRSRYDGFDNIIQEPIMSARTVHAHSTPDPETPPPVPEKEPPPDIQPVPEAPPVEEPRAPQPPIKA
jgi:hypothetical protein